MRELIIGKNDAGQRLDKFITKALDMPMSLLYKSIRLKKIKVNRKRAEASQKLIEGDTVQCFIADEFFEKGKKVGFSEGSAITSATMHWLSLVLPVCRWAGLLLSLICWQMTGFLRNKEGSP